MNITQILNAVEKNSLTNSIVTLRANLKDGYFEINSEAMEIEFVEWIQRADFVENCVYSFIGDTAFDVTIFIKEEELTLTWSA